MYIAFRLLGYIWHDEFYGLIVCCDYRSRESLVLTICSFKEIEIPSVLVV